MSNLNKITNEDIIDSGTFTGGTYGTNNQQAIESIGTVTSLASKLVKRGSSSEINCSNLICTGITSLALDMEGPANKLGFYGATAITQPLTIDAPVLAVGSNDNEKSAEAIWFSSNIKNSFSCTENNTF